MQVVLSLFSIGLFCLARQKLFVCMVVCFLGCIVLMCHMRCGKSVM